MIEYRKLYHIGRLAVFRWRKWRNCHSPGEPLSSLLLTFSPENTQEVQWCYFTWKWAAIPSVHRGTVLFLKLSNRLNKLARLSSSRYLGLDCVPYLSSHTSTGLSLSTKQKHIQYWKYSVFQGHWYIFPTLPCHSKSIHYAFLLLVCQPPVREG